MSEKEIASTDDLLAAAYAVWQKIESGYFKSDLLRGAEGDFEIILSQHILADAIGHAYADLMRWSSFHLSSTPTARPDRHKYGGFLAKWIAKCRPILIKPLNSSAVIPLPLLRINALYAMWIIEFFLNIKERNNEIELEKIEKELVYRLHFRDETAENLAFVAYCYETIAKLPSTTNP